MSIMCRQYVMQKQNRLLHLQNILGVPIYIIIYLIYNYA